jgi:ankyrin repeat protein
VAKLSVDGRLPFMGIPRSQSPGMGKDPGKDDQERISLNMTANQLDEAPSFKKFLNMRLPLNAQDRHGASLRMIAASQGNADVVKLLLAAGAEPNLGNKSGAIALFWAKKNNHPEVVKILLTGKEG